MAAVRFGQLSVISSKDCLRSSISLFDPKVNTNDRTRVLPSGYFPNLRGLSSSKCDAGSKCSRRCRDINGAWKDLWDSCERWSGSWNSNVVNCECSWPCRADRVLRSAFVCHQDHGRSLPFLPRVQIVAVGALAGRPQRGQNECGSQLSKRAGCKGLSAQHDQSESRFWLDCNRVTRYGCCLSSLGSWVNYCWNDNTFIDGAHRLYARVFDPKDGHSIHKGPPTDSSNAGRLVCLCRIQTSFDKTVMTNGIGVLGR